MGTRPMAPKLGYDAMPSRTVRRDEVVELGLLLPANRAEALVVLAHQRQQSVGQFLRTLIDHALTKGD